MARKDPDSERRKRAGEDLDKALRRGDLDLALASLEKMRRDFPPGALERVAPALRRALLDAHRMSQWARLHALAVRTEGIPALLETGAGACEAEAGRWALLWGCVRSRDFVRARALGRTLGPSLAGPPAVARCLTEILDLEGNVSDDLLAILPESLRRGTDARLGHDAPPARAETPPAPTSPESAREAVLLAVHRLPPLGLADCLERWITEASPAVAEAIRTPARLAARWQILRRFRDGAPLGAAVRVLLAAVNRANRTREEVATLIEAIRLASTRSGAAPDLERDPDGLALLGRALLPEPTFGAAGARWLVSVTGAAAAGPGSDRLFERALQAHPADLALWALVCSHVVDPDDDRAPRPPSWLWQGLERLCADAGVLARSWTAVPADQVGPLVGRLTASIPLTLGLRLVEQSWPAASAELRGHLCHLAGELSDEGFSRADLDELDELDLDASMRKMANRLVVQTLSGPTRSFWTRLGGELLEADPHLLVFAIQAAGDALTERRRFLVAWLDGRKVVDEWLGALGDVLHVPVHEQELCDTIIDHLLARFGRDCDSLARALLRLEGRAPVPAVMRLAQALIDVAPRRTQDRSLTVREALALARGLSKGRPVAQRRRKRQAEPEAAAARRGQPGQARRARRPPEQLELAMVGEPVGAESSP